MTGFLGERQKLNGRSSVSALRVMRVEDISFIHWPVFFFVSGDVFIWSVFFFEMSRSGSAKRGRLLIKKDFRIFKKILSLFNATVK